LAEGTRQSPVTSSDLPTSEPGALQACWRGEHKTRCRLRFDAVSKMMSFTGTISVTVGYLDQFGLGIAPVTNAFRPGPPARERRNNFAELDVIRSATRC